jgi:hypothetical protein
MMTLGFESLRQPLHLSHVLTYTCLRAQVFISASLSLTSLQLTKKKVILLEQGFSNLFFRGGIPTIILHIPINPCV